MDLNNNTWKRNKEKKKKKQTNKQTYHVVAIEWRWNHKAQLRHWRQDDDATCHDGSSLSVSLSSPWCSDLAFSSFHQFQINEIEFANF